MTYRRQQLIDKTPIMHLPETVCELFFININLLNTIQIPLYRLFYGQLSCLILLERHLGFGRDQGILPNF